MNAEKEELVLLVGMQNGAGVTGILAAEKVCFHKGPSGPGKETLFWEGYIHGF